MANPYKMRLLANLPIYADKIPIYSPSLKSIAELGKEEYSALLSTCMITKNNLKESLGDCRDDFDVLIRLCVEHGLFYSFLYSLFYFTKLEFKLENKDNDLVFLCEDKELNRKNYSKFIDCIKVANGIEIDDSKEELDEFDRQVLEMERKIREAQNQNTDPIELEDFISAVANMDGNGLNIINVWDLNIYQFHEQLQRGQLKENYRLTIKQLLAGAKPDDIKVEHYIKTIK